MKESPSWPGVLGRSLSEQESVHSMLSSGFTNHCLYYSILFVHGLQGHPRKTWTSSPAANNDDEEGRIDWIRRFMEKVGFGKRERGGT